ncbi:ribonuclease H-like domain-containing protein [Tanacetum coccineum]
MSSRANTLKLGDLSINAYFHKFECIAIILISLGSPISNDDVVTIALEGLPDKYGNVSGIIVHWEPFLDLKMVCSMLSTEDMRLKSRAQASPIDSTSSSPLVLLANRGNSTRRPNVTLKKVLLRCDSTGDLYPVMKPSTIPHVFLTSQYTWHQRLGYPRSEVLCRLFSSNSISCNKEKPLVLCHVCQLGKHVRLSFSSNVISNIIRSSPIAPTTNHPRTTILPVHSVSPSLTSSAQQPTLTATFQRTTSNTAQPILHKRTLSMWLFRHKYLADGTLSRYKAHLVVNGSTQLEGIDVDETFSPVVKSGTIPTIISLATSRHWLVHQLDVKNAFLHGDLSETVYMHQPLGFQDSAHPYYDCLLQRSLYGLKQGTDTAYLLLYVDDIVFTASSEILLQQLIGLLHLEFSMTDLGSLNYFLGISVMRDSSGMFLSQRKYVVKILERAHVVHCNPSRTPIDNESKSPDGDSVSNHTLYRSLAGALQYLTFTHLNISYVMHQVCLYMHDPRKPHFSALKWILRYVCGYYVFLGNNLLSWSSKRQSMLSRSSAEAEYHGVANVVAETYWLKNLLHEFHTPLSTATLVYNDNVDLVAAGHVRVLHVPSCYQFAYILTKGLPSALFEEFRTSLSVRCPPTQTVGEC